MAGMPRSQLEPSAAGTAQAISSLCAALCSVITLDFAFDWPFVCGAHKGGQPSLSVGYMRVGAAVETPLIRSVPAPSADAHAFCRGSALIGNIVALRTRFAGPHGRNDTARAPMFPKGPRFEAPGWRADMTGYDGCGSPKMHRTVSRAISSSSFVGMTHACRLDPSVLMRPSRPTVCWF